MCVIVTVLYVIVTVLYVIVTVMYVIVTVWYVIVTVLYVIVTVMYVTVTVMYVIVTVLFVIVTVLYVIVTVMYVGVSVGVVHVYSQLFGELDADEDVSPDTEDPEVSGSSPEPHQPIRRISTREWVSSCNYHPDKLFQKVCIYFEMYYCIYKI